MQVQSVSNKYDRDFKPTRNMSQLEQMIRAKKPFLLQNFIEYCYHTVSQIQPTQKGLTQQTINRIQHINNHKVHAKVMPCLIYQHLSETFCSMVEAHRDGDWQLLKAEIEEANESIRSFMVDREYGYYESFNHLEIDENMADVIIKEKLEMTINQLVGEYEKIASSSSFKIKGKKLKNNRNATLKAIKQKQQAIKKRQEQKVKPLLNKLLGRVKKLNQGDIKMENQAEEKEYILGLGISKYRGSV